MTPALFEKIKAFADGFTGTVVEIGSRPAEGQESMAVKPLFANHTGIDIQDGPCVDIVDDLTGEHVTKSDHAVETADAVLCLETLEHVPAFWRILAAFQTMNRGATLILSFPAFGFPYHPHPVDCYRFSPDAIPALMEGFSIDETAVLYDTAGNRTLFVRGTRI